MTSSGSVQVLGGREVPLGGIRALTVRRTLPHRDRSFVGAWCFVDHYGPVDVDPDGSGGMDVPPHPHTGLQTVSWLFAGHIEHRDSAGVLGQVLPGEVNLMTAGDGIAHSEVSVAGPSVLHGVQLWVALPDESRSGEREFEHYAPDPVDLPAGSGTALVFLGSLEGVAASPVHTYTPLLGAQLDLVAGARLELSVDPGFEHGLLVDTGSVTFEGQPLGPADLGCVDEGRDRLVLEVGDDPARVVLLGGTPFEEEIVMWWNFVGRSHDEVAAAREQWEAGSDRFGTVDGHEGEVSRIPAPPLPGVRLKSRGRRGRR